MAKKKDTAQAESAVYNFVSTSLDFRDHVEGIVRETKPRSFERISQLRLPECLDDMQRRYEAALAEVSGKWVYIMPLLDNLSKAIKRLADASVSALYNSKDWGFCFVAFNEAFNEIESKAKAMPLPAAVKEPVSPLARIIFDKLNSLRPLDAMTTEQLLDWLSKMHNKTIDDKTLRLALTELEPYGKANKPRTGYYIKK